MILYYSITSKRLLLEYSEAIFNSCSNSLCTRQTAGARPACDKGTEIITGKN